MKNKKMINAVFVIIAILLVGLLSCKKQHVHQWVEANCVTPKRCTECGKTEGDPLGHTIETIELEPTCTTNGSVYTICSVCGEKNILSVITSLGHSYGEWKVVLEPTYETEGKKTRTCARCNVVEEEAIPMLNNTDKINEVISKLKMVEATSENLDLPTLIDGVTITWVSARPTILSNTGVINRGAKDTNVSILATFTYEGTSVQNRYTVKVLGYTVEEKLNMVFSTISFPNLINIDLVLPNSYQYGVVASYSSSNTDILSNDGKVKLGEKQETVTLTVLLELEGVKMSKDYNLTIDKIEKIKYHQLITRFDDFVVKTDSPFEIIKNRLVLKDGLSEGTFESDIITTKAFSSLVCSWAATSSKSATIEVLVSARINGVWSEYITYSPWGLGLKNASNNQTKGNISLDQDEVIIHNNLTADAINYKVIFRRTSTDVESPKLSLVSFALEIDNYNYYVDNSNIKEEVCYDVPKLNQNVVPGIGNSICSATSTTMLLKYKGLSFTKFDSEYEHRYIAGIVKDYGNNIYGNWVYNTVTMGAYGFNAYVARMYSVDELVHHLSEVGPVALSVKGTMISSEKTYTTNGHLIVAVGYRYIDGKLYIICNDPNVSNVRCEYSVDVIKATWRKICYVIE